MDSEFVSSAVVVLVVVAVVEAAVGGDGGGGDAVVSSVRDVPDPSVSVSMVSMVSMATARSLAEVDDPFQRRKSHVCNDLGLRRLM